MNAKKRVRTARLMKVAFWNSFPVLKRQPLRAWVVIDEFSDYPKAQWERIKAEAAKIYTLPMEMA